MTPEKRDQDAAAKLREDFEAAILEQISTARSEGRQEGEAEAGALREACEAVLSALYGRNGASSVLGSGHVLKYAARHIENWHADPKADVVGNAQKIQREQESIHAALVAVSQQVQAALSSTTAGVDLLKRLEDAESALREAERKVRAFDWLQHEAIIINGEWFKIRIPLKRGPDFEIPEFLQAVEAAQKDTK